MPYEKKVKIDYFLSNVSSLLFHNLWKVGLRAQKILKTIKEIKHEILQCQNNRCAKIIYICGMIM